MNRLVIIGNGFDLAHGLPTGYCDFIDWYWVKVSRSIKYHITTLTYNDGILGIEMDCDYYVASNLRRTLIKEAVNYKTFIEAFQALREVFPEVKDWDEYIVITNDFFKIIHDKNYIQNWVDIENEYYDILKDCLKEEGERKYKTDVKKLNEEFEQIKNLFEQYLTEEVYDKYDFENPNAEINTLIKEFNVWNRVESKTDFIEEFPEGEKGVEDYCKILKQYNTSGGTNITKYLESENHQVKNYFLSFNYTPTLTSYLSKMKNDDMNYFGENTLIQIHGCLNDDKNKINFGFGDEMDDDYKTIENKNDNEYLKYIKSFQYAQNDNYKRLLDFIDSEKFQVYLIGHSCGLSDRILLNTIFEHENCRSIKIYYYDKGNGEDNYTTIVQNISRHFNDKKLMRSKIVNKSLCKPLHQKVRFEKKK